jgi:hypothetical protein
MKDLLGISEVVEILGKSRHQVRYLVLTGELKPDEEVAHGRNGKRRFWHRATITRYKQKQKKA